MQKLPITHLEATLLLPHGENIQVPPMPPRRQVSIEEFEADREHWAVLEVLHGFDDRALGYPSR